MMEYRVMRSFILIMLSFLTVISSISMLSAETMQAGYIAAQSGLMLRAEPDLKAPVIARMPYGTRVRYGKPSAASAVAISVEGIKSHWAPVEFGDTSGYAFAGYIMPDVGSHQDRALIAYTHLLTQIKMDATRNVTLQSVAQLIDIRRIEDFLLFHVHMEYLDPNVDPVSCDSDISIYNLASSVPQPLKQQACSFTVLDANGDGRQDILVEFGACCWQEFTLLLNRTTSFARVEPLRAMASTKTGIRSLQSCADLKIAVEPQESEIQTFVDHYIYRFDCTTESWQIESEIPVKR